MAEVARIISEKPIVPRYELAPLLRSFEPNLAVYRSLGLPVFRPREGHVFIAGKLPHLRASCLAAVGIRRGYVGYGLSRLHNYLLNETAPLTVIGNELRERWTDPQRALIPPRPEPTGERSDEWWNMIAGALLDTVLLGLPDVFLTTMLRCDYGLNHLNEHDVRDLRQALVDCIPDLEAFLDDATLDVLATRGHMTANDAITQLLNREHPEATGPTLRNDVVHQNREGPEGIMGWEQRNGSGRRYYFRSERRAGKVVKTYLGSQADPLAQWIARADCLTRAIAQSERVADQAGISPDSDESVATFCRVVRAVERSMGRGFAMDGNMPEDRAPSTSGQLGAEANTLPTQGEFAALALRADRGNGAAQAEVRRLLDRHQELWKSIGDLGQLVEDRLIDVLTDRSFALREAVYRFEISSISRRPSHIWDFKDLIGSARRAVGVQACLWRCRS